VSNEQLLKETTNQLREFLATKNVMGDPVDFGEKVVIPVARYGFAFGTAASHEKDGGCQGAGDVQIAADRIIPRPSSGRHPFPAVGKCGNLPTQIKVIRRMRILSLRCTKGDVGR